MAETEASRNCTNPDDCVSNANCTDDTCLYEAGYQDQNELHSLPLLGKECDSVVGCDGNNTECSEGRCNSTTEFQDSDGVFKAEAVRNCTNVEDCVSNANCTDDTCQHITGYQEKNKPSMLPYLGEDCDSAVGCDARNTECLQGKCKCKTEFLESGGVCKGKAGTTCTNVEDCVSNASCKGDTCQCNEGYEEQNKLCRLPHLGDKCFSAVGCDGNSTECSEGKCKCTTAFVESDGFCRLPRLGQECDSAVGCDAYNTKCSKGRCECKTEFVENDGICIKSYPGLGEKCIPDIVKCVTHHAQCVPALPESLCANRTKTFTSLLRTISHSSLDLSEKLLTGFDEELEFVAAQSTFLIEIHGQKKGARSNPLIFPSTESKTYLKLPGTSEGDSDGNHYSYVGVLYAVQYLEQLLPGHQNVLREQKTLNSKLLSFTWKGEPTLQLTNPVTLVMENLHHIQDPPYRDIWRDLHEGEEPTFVPRSHRCSFWNFSEQGYWDTTGCREVSSDRKQTVCECSHFTDFGILMDSHQYVGRSVALEIFLIFISSLSMIGLVFSLVVFHMNRNENSTLVNPSQQLCLCLLLGQICLFLLIDRYIFNLSEVGCAITGMFMHLIFLCIYMWLALECLSIYRKLVGKPKRFRLSTRAHFIVGYGVPFGIVCITALVSFGTRTHGYGAGEL
ncbi:unnamed protein product [Darwinula stevensoni]|uniref:Uncharacterized protein n=1 Tax=Darwinula stevensoni TaxID=69355 RepID=A0A7R9A0U4_9CRUS|nr:unnamed protein product [Darwinula stevensoni]CAG0881982.1 unnamed protein product [Darwinula stevensoni]